MSSLIRTATRRLKRLAAAEPITTAAKTAPKKVSPRRAPKGRRKSDSYRAAARNAERSSRRHAHNNAKPQVKATGPSFAAPNGKREVERRLRHAAALAAKAA